MKIYRLQDSDGLGPYCNFRLMECVTDKHNKDLDKWPSAQNDVVNFDYSIDLLGCTSITKLEEWFGKVTIRKAKKLGFYITCYEIDKCYVKFSFSGKQVAFDPELAEREYKVK